MRVFVISHDLSHNCLGRAVLLAQLIGRRHEVELIGPSFGPDVWFPARRCFDYRKVDGEIFLPQYTHLYARLLDKLKGKLTIAVKPRPTSFGLALMQRELTRQPLILDIDDDELAMYDGQNWKEWDTKTLLRRPNSPLYTSMLEKLIPTANSITTATRTLQKKYGGTYLPHVKDHELLDPDRFVKAAEREKRDLPKDEKLIVFAGSPREHKGLDMLLSAIRRLERSDVRLLIVGASNDPGDKVEAELRQVGGDWLYMLKQTPLEDLPAILAMADLVVLPQRKTRAAQAQIPSKLFDAMSMALPIVATDVSDVAEILGGDSGRVVEPENDLALADAVAEILEAPEEAEAMGRRARARLIENYSFDAFDDTIHQLIKSTARRKHAHEIA